MPTSRDLDAELDQRLQRFAVLGMSRAGMLAQLMLAGYPVDRLRSRFCWNGSCPTSCMRCRKFSLRARIAPSLSIARIAGTLVSQVVDRLHGFTAEFTRNPCGSSAR